MHCHICDFSDTGRSDYYHSLAAVVDPRHNTVVLDPKTGKYVCIDCLGASLANYRSLIPYTDKEEQEGEIETLDTDFDTTGA